MQQTVWIWWIALMALGSISSSSSSGCSSHESHRPHSVGNATDPLLLSESLRALDLIDRYRLEDAARVVANLVSRFPGDPAARGLGEVLEQHLAHAARRLVDTTVPALAASGRDVPGASEPTSDAVARSAELKRAGLRFYSEGHARSALKLWRVALELNWRDRELEQFIARAETVLDAGSEPLDPKSEP